MDTPHFRAGLHESLPTCYIAASREAVEPTLYVPWKCCMSSAFTYEGVMSVPPPNHHCPGMPFHSCTQAGHLLLVCCAA